MSVRSNVDIGSLNERITLQRKSLSQDASGRSTYSFTTLITCWAKVDGRKVDASRSEPSQAGQVGQMYDYVVWIRSDVFTRFSISSEDRIQWRGHVLDVTDAPDQQLRGRLIPLFCRRGSSDG